jgi:hypothetical protein
MMKRLLSIVLLLCVAPAMFAATSALTSKGALYTIDPKPAENVVSLIRRSGEVKETIVVPATEDAGVLDYRAQLEYDRVTDKLYVIWVRKTERLASVMVSSLDSEGAWSNPVVLATASPLAVRGDIRTALTRAASGETKATVIHVASWVRDGDLLIGEYVLAAFDRNGNFSTSVNDLEAMASLGLASQEAGDINATAVFPPLAIAAANDGIDVVFGRERGTTITRMHITPRLEPNARIWKPVGKTGGGVMPPSKIAANSANTKPVKAFFSRDRIVLYTDDQAFRFVIFENGQWSPVRTLTLDENLTGDALINELRRVIEEELPPAEDLSPVTQ